MQTLLKVLRMFNFDKLICSLLHTMTSLQMNLRDAIKVTRTQLRWSRAVPAPASPSSSHMLT